MPECHAPCIRKGRATPPRGSCGTLCVIDYCRRQPLSETLSAIKALVAAGEFGYPSTATTSWRRTIFSLKTFLWAYTTP